jgi:hypothetical protein
MFDLISASIDSQRPNDGGGRYLAIFAGPEAEAAPMGAGASGRPSTPGILPGCRSG